MKLRPLEIVTLIMAIIIFLFVSYNLYFDFKVKNIMNSKDITVLNKENSSNTTINIEKGSEYVTSEGVLEKHIIIPQFAIWIEDMDGIYVKTIYVTPEQANVKRNYFLPVWSRLNGVDVNMKTSITPKGNSTIEIQKPNLNKFNILLEINKLYDPNKYYNIGEKNNGQPSLVYIATIDGTKKTYKMELYGHGSTTGVDGIIYRDVSGITTAKDILKEVNIIVK